MLKKIVKCCVQTMILLSKASFSLADIKTINIFNLMFQIKKKQQRIFRYSSKGVMLFVNGVYLICKFSRVVFQKRNQSIIVRTILRQLIKHHTINKIQLCWIFPFYVLIKNMNVKDKHKKTQFVKQTRVNQYLEHWTGHVSHSNTKWYFY